MNFKEEYIKAAEEMNPDKQTIDRMKANVLEMTRRKRAFPFKTAAAVGGTVAACAVITLAAAHLVPKSSNDYFAPTENFSVTAGGSPAGSGSGKEQNQDAAAYDFSEYEDEIEAEICDEIDDDCDYFEGYEYIGYGKYFSSSEAADQNAYEEISEADSVGSGYYAPNTVSPSAGHSEPLITPDLNGKDVSADTDEAFFDEYTLTISEDWSECVITDGEQQYIFDILINGFDFVSDPSVPYAILTNTTDNKSYYVAFENNILIVRDEEFNLAGLFE